ncbi:ABC transporter permease [Propionibacterium australiense]|uniref:FtsX-like permease family n=1 Tax=Propionibacterium australiense TaxID=119981 RepID=A0A383S8B9_9ACTN|nr:ABC transporter permease [Propionibacterium australiense]RLP09609.1 FtsX-like permease family protein [Propionibacterium australiense]RLP12311.1 FtsX-like permease family protein [Propionibacterium australiense]SYZ33506.1 FtsX-like permease family [Propionibacterium australiense]VEH89659.1 acidobacterial duplicated orphan permease [Propionibacterium australiense]
MIKIHNPAHVLPFSSLQKFALGSAWSMAGRLMVLIAVASMAFSILVGEYSAMSSITKARNNWYSEGHLADLELRFTPSPNQPAPRFDGLSGLAGSTSRQVLSGRTQLAETNDLALTVIFSDSVWAGTRLNILTPLKGTLLTRDDDSGALIDQSMAKYHSVDVGDSLEIEVGGATRTITVRGIVRDPEFLIAPLNPSLFVSAKGSMGVVYLSPSEASSVANSVVFDFESGQDLDAAREAVLNEAAAQNLTGAYAMKREEQFAYQYVEKNLDVFDVVIPLMVLVGALSAAFVSMFLSAQWIARERKGIAVLLVQGHQPAAVARAYVLPYMWLVGWTIIMGLLGSVLVGHAFLENFASSVGLPSVPFILDPVMIAIGCIGTLAVYGLGAALTFERIFRMTPRDAMTRTIDTGRSGRVRGVRLGALVPNTTARLSIRNVQRNPWVSVLTTLAIAIGFGLTAAYFLSYSSVIATSRSAVVGNEWDLTVDFAEPQSDAQAAALMSKAGVSEWTPTIKTAAQATNGSVIENLLIGGFDPKNTWHKVTLVEGSDISESDPDGVVLEAGLARRLALEPGDTFTIKAAGTEHEARVVGIMSSALPGEVRSTVVFTSSLTGSDLFSGVLVKVSPDKIPSTTNALNSESGVQQALNKDEIVKLIVASSDQITALLWLGALTSIVVALLFVAACLGYTILERRREYLLLGLLGFRNRTIRGTVVMEASLLGLSGIVIAFPVAWLVSRLLNERISDVWFNIDSQLSAQPFLMTFGPGLVLLPLAALPLAQWVLRASGSDNRERGIG